MDPWNLPTLGNILGLYAHVYIYNIYTYAVYVNTLVWKHDVKTLYIYTLYMHIVYVHIYIYITNLHTYHI